MPGQLKSILSRPYDLFENKHFRIYMVIIPSFFVSLFIFMFMPFGYGYTERKFILSLSVSCGVITGFVMFINLFVIQKYIFSYFTIGRAIIWNTWLLICIGFVNALMVTIVFFKGNIIIRYFFEMQGYTLSLGTVISLFMVLMHYNYQLKKKLTEYNINLESKIENENKFIKFTDNNGKPFKIRRDELCYITCADNYIDIFYIENNKLKHILLRLTLKLADTVLKEFPEFKRCHRSYIVNLKHAKKIISSHKGYKLLFNNINQPIPVSRNYKKEISLFLNSQNFA